MAAWTYSPPEIDFDIVVEMADNFEVISGAELGRGLKRKRSFGEKTVSRSTNSQLKFLGRTDRKLH